MISLKVNLIKDKNIAKCLILFAIPVLISNLFQNLYNTVDTIIIGNTLGDASLAAVGATGAIYELLIGFALGIGNGLSIVSARAYGANDIKTLKKSVAGSIVIGLMVTALIMIISVLFLKPLLEILNTPVNILEQSYEYISVITMFVGVMFAYNLFSGLLRAIGDSITPLIFLILSSIINIILDVIFMTELNMGIKGAAVATVIAQGISAVLCLIYIIKKAPILIPTKEDFKIKKELYSELVGQGLSMGLMLSIVSIGSVILQTSINNLGYLTIAGHTAARKLNSFLCMPVAIIGVALSTFVSQNKGAKQYSRIRRGVKIGNILVLAISVVVTIFLFFTVEPLVKFVSGSSEAVVIDNAVRYLLVNSPFYVVLGMLFNFRTSLQGLGMKIVPLISSIIELIGKVIFVMILIPRLDYFGVIICEPIIWCIMTLQLRYSFKKEIKNLENEETISTDKLALK